MYFSCIYALTSMPLHTQGVHGWSPELSVQISDIWLSLLQTQIFLVSFNQRPARLCFCFPLCESQSGNCCKIIAYDNCKAHLVFSPYISGIIVLYCLMSSILKKIIVSCIVSSFLLWFLLRRSVWSLSLVPNQKSSQFCFLLGELSNIVRKPLPLILWEFSAVLDLRLHSSRPRRKDSVLFLVTEIKFPSLVLIELE